MPKKHHSGEKIISALKLHESGEKTADICRKLGVSQATFYTWKKQSARPFDTTLSWRAAAPRMSQNILKHHLVQTQLGNRIIKTTVLSL